MITPTAWHFTDVVDVRIEGPAPVAAGRSPTPPERPLLHIGAAAVTTHCRPLAKDLMRLRLDRALPLRIGDRALLRDPGSRTFWGVTVLDPAPPPLKRRGAAGERARALHSHSAEPDLHREVERRGLVHVSLLKRIGIPLPAEEPLGCNTGGWLISGSRAAQARREIERIVVDHDHHAPLGPGVPLLALTERLGLPSPYLVRTLVRPPLRVADGRVGQRSAVLPASLERAVEAVHEDLADDPFVAPTADRLRELGLDHRVIAAAARAGRLLRLGNGNVLMPGAELLAKQWLDDLPQPFTTSEARVRLGTSRRVVLPLLAHLDKLGATRRLPDDRRTVAR